MVRVTFHIEGKNKMHYDLNFVKDNDKADILDISALEFAFALSNLLYLLDCSAIQLKDEFNYICHEKSDQQNTKYEKDTINYDKKIKGLEIDRIIFFINFNLYIIKNLTSGNTCVYLDNIYDKEIIYIFEDHFPIFKDIIECMNEKKDILDGFIDYVYTEDYYKLTLKFGSKERINEDILKIEEYAGKKSKKIFESIDTYKNLLNNKYIFDFESKALFCNKDLENIENLEDNPKDDKDNNLKAVFLRRYFIYESFIEQKFEKMVKSNLDFSKKYENGEYTNAKDEQKRGDNLQELNKNILDPDKLAFFWEILYKEKIPACLQKEADLITVNSFKKLLKTFSEDFQKLAILKSILNKVTIITGGPGTGKTHTICCIILALILVNNINPGRIAIAAPTGKAANRIEESIDDFFRKTLNETVLKYLYDRSNNILSMNSEIEKNLDIDELLKQIKPETIHRLLGYRADSSSFKFYEKNPLEHDVVIIDEASMVDVSLMANLLFAIKEDSKLIIVGDANQLSSVEAGMVLSDIVQFYLRNYYKNKKLETKIDLFSLDEDDYILNSPLVILKKTFRQEEKTFAKELQEKLEDLIVLEGREVYSAAENLVSFIKDKNRLISLDMLDTGTKPGMKDNDEKIVELIKIISEKFPDYFNNSFFKEFQDKVFEVDNENNFLFKIENIDKNFINACYEHFRYLKFLSPVRYSRYGINYLNKTFMKILFRSKNQICKGFIPIPIMITKNDYDLNLFNGDIGFLLLTEERKQVFFEDGRIFELNSLTSWELAYFLTVHKSQGSEYDNIVLVLPEDSKHIEIIGLQMIYTALTRAKKDVYIFSDEESLTFALSKRVRRTTGLFQKI